MSFLPYLVTRTDECTFIDGMVMYDLPDDVYREYARHGVFFTDHHGALRFEARVRSSRPIGSSSIC